MPRQWALYKGRKRELLKMPHAVLDPARTINLMIVSCTNNIVSKTVEKTPMLSASKVKEDTFNLFVKVKIFHNPSYGKVNGDAKKPKVASKYSN